MRTTFLACPTLGISLCTAFAHAQSVPTTAEPPTATPGPAEVTYHSPAAEHPAPPPGAAPTPTPDAPPDAGVLLQARLATDQRIVDQTVPATPIASSFVVGFHTGMLSFGALVGFSRTASDAGDGDDSLEFASSTWQLAPIFFWDVWRSADAHTRVNLVGSVGYGKMSQDAQLCPGCENVKTTATVVPLTAALGADHFISRHFAIGLEGGLQALFLSDMEVEDENVDAGMDSQWLYGMLRLSVLVGD